MFRMKTLVLFLLLALAFSACGGGGAPEWALAGNTTGVTPPAPPAPPPLTGTALGTLADSMAPGTWAQLNVSASNQNAILGVGSVSGSMIGYSNSMPWNPFSKVIEIIGMDHNWGASRHARYDVATNQFILVAADNGFGTQTQHGYDHNTVNPYTGDLYSRLFGLGDMSARKKVLGAPNFVDIPSAVAYGQVAIGTTWWSGPFVGGGSQGSFMIFNSGNAAGNANDGQILAYNPLTNTWFYNKEGMAPNYGSGPTYHSVIEYSHTWNVAVYGGGNVASNRLWRISSDGSVLAMPNVPSGKTVGVEQGLLVGEPVTGNFLLLSAGQLWELNPGGSGTWTQQSPPPGGVGIPGSSFVITSSIPDYGVVAFITQPNQNGGSFYLYKHQ